MTVRVWDDRGVTDDATAVCGGCGEVQWWWIAFVGYGTGFQLCYSCLREAVSACNDHLPKASSRCFVCEAGSGPAVLCSACGLSHPDPRAGLTDREREVLDMNANDATPATQETIRAAEARALARLRAKT